MLLPSVQTDRSRRDSMRQSHVAAFPYICQYDTGGLVYDAALCSGLLLLSLTPS